MKLGIRGRRRALWVLLAMMGLFGFRRAEGGSAMQQGPTYKLQVGFSMDVMVDDATNTTVLCLDYKPIPIGAVVREETVNSSGVKISNGMVGATVSASSAQHGSIAPLSATTFAHGFGAQGRPTKRYADFTYTPTSEGYEVLTFRATLPASAANPNLVLTDTLEFQVIQCNLGVSMIYYNSVPGFGQAMGILDGVVLTSTGEQRVSGSGMWAFNLYWVLGGCGTVSSSFAIPTEISGQVLADTLELNFAYGQFSAPFTSTCASMPSGVTETVDLSTFTVSQASFPAAGGVGRFAMSEGTVTIIVTREEEPEAVGALLR